MRRLRTRLRVLRRRGPRGLIRSAAWFLTKVAVIFVLTCMVWVAAYRFIAPPITYLMVTEWVRTGDLTRDWRGLEQISPDLARTVLAAEDANFCAHHGFDFAEIQKALADDGRRRGASTISQQVAKNAFLWPKASWTRKGFEAGFTVLIELFWPKARIVEVYLNIAEFDEGVFGAEAAARRYFDKSAADLSLTQAARLAAVLPNPRGRDARKISASRTAAIKDGAETLKRDGRAACVTVDEG